MAETLRYGVIGAKTSGISAEHLRNILRLSDVDVAALCNTNPEELAKAAQGVLGAPALYQQAEARLATERLDLRRE
ncbi:MAG: hypothetical protein ACR2JY_13530 [Chloroflexota bacterium]